MTTEVEPLRKGTLGARNSASGRWLSIRDIAADLGISLSTAYKWSARGQPYFPRVIRLRNREVRVRWDWYEDWLEQFDPLRDQ